MCCCFLEVISSESTCCTIYMLFVLTVDYVAGTPLPSTIMDCVQLRGLPYSASKTQVLEFFAGLSLGEGGIHFIYDGSGRPTGNGYVHFGAVEDAIKATEKHKHHMGNRYIEVFRCPRIEMINAVGPFRFNLPQNPWSPSSSHPNGSSGSSELLSPNPIFPSSPGSFSPVVLPQASGVSWEQQSDLASSAYALDQATQNLLKTQQSWPRMSTFSPDNSSSSTGNFCSPGSKSKDVIGSALLSPNIASTQSSPINDLHLDLLRSLSQVSVQDNNPAPLTSEQIADNLFSALPNLFNSDSFLAGTSTEEQRPTSWSDGLVGTPAAKPSRNIVRMRGIPYNTDKFEILNFFHGFNLSENDIYICYNDDGKPTGEAYVQFLSLEEAQRAVVEKDRKHIGPRYVELFLDR